SCVKLRHLTTLAPGLRAGRAGRIVAQASKHHCVPVLLERGEGRAACSSMCTRTRLRLSQAPATLAWICADSGLMLQVIHILIDEIEAGRHLKLAIELLAKRSDRIGRNVEIKS